MKTFGTVCYRICIISILVCLIPAILMIWTESYTDTMMRLMGTGFAIFMAAGIAFAINREFLKHPDQKTSDQKK